MVDYRETPGNYINALGIELGEPREGLAVAVLPVSEKHLSPIGMVHGGAISSLVDTNMGHALTSLLPPDQKCVTVEMKINYISSVAAGTLICKARVVSKGRTVAVVQASVETEAGQLVALATGSFYIKRVNREQPRAG